jgi:archaemetzincin
LRRLRIAIVRVGHVEGGILERVQFSLSEVFPETNAFVVGGIMPLPDDAYNPRRGQYHSSRILSCIRAGYQPVHGDRVLGVTEADLYVPSLNFVFGEAGRYGSAIISLFRLRPEFYGEPRDVGLFLERASKEAVHELGHTLGLGHCPDPGCVMFFSNSIIDTDRKNRTFCKACHPEALRTVEKLG